MKFMTETIVLAVGAFIALLGAAFAQDRLFEAHMWVLFFVLLASTLFMVRRISFAPAVASKSSSGDDGYFDEVIKYGVIATVFWGVVGFLVGVVVALQLAFPDLNIEPWLNFGRTRPLHTSAVIFAFGGNALIATSFYVVQRTSRARLFGGNLGWFVFWGYQLFIVMAATGYLLGITQGREYAEPEWYVDLWLTVVWVCYLIAFLGTIMTRKEPHIYVANWFFLSFIVTIAMLHIVNNLAVPVSFLGVKSYSAFSGVQDALTQWWYGHNAVGFFLTAGFLG
uniref:cbb3-type cytochrome c oxidase subunit I n=1 Tax=Shinella sp. TaxID=1870904 RepID=UPI003F6F99FA